MAKAVRCLNCGQMGGKHSFPNFHCPDHANKGKFLADQTMQSDIGIPFRKRLLEALGWQGGTVAQALEEVRRLKALSVFTNPELGEPWHFVEIGKVALLGSVVWKDFAGIDAYKRIGLKVFAVSRDKPLGKGVAALLPEHGVVKA